MVGLPSGTVTFLFTDIEHSTRKIASVGDERYAELQEVHRQLLREAFYAHGGCEVSTEGDAFFIAFEDATAALGAAIDAQRAMESHAWTAEGRLRVRIGLHTGEALVRDGDYVGHAVHKAKRVADAGHGGQILVSESTRDTIRDRLPLGVTVTSLGPHRLKDLGEPQPIFQINDGPAAGFPPLRSLEMFATNLPRMRSAFVGRAREIRALRELLERERLITLTGIGGCGKTRLAIQVAAESLDGFPDGVFFVDLARIGQPESLAAAVTESIESALGGGQGRSGESPGSTRERLLHQLEQRTALLVLDNCEHLVYAIAELVDELQQRCGRVTVLATSREALSVEGERVVGVPSLGLPEGDESDCEAASLFSARATASAPSIRFGPEQLRVVGEICRRVDGIPLAIELAAAQVTHLSLEQIEERLSDRFRLLTGGHRRIQRQQTLRATLDWSHDLLTASERAVLRRIAVFPADFSLEAAEGICSDDTVAPTEVLGIVGSLVGKSLLEIDAGSAEVRYRFLESVRAYATERLSEAGEAEQLRDRHRDWFLGWIEGLSWTDVMCPTLDSNPELADVRAALAWSETQGRAEVICRIFTRSQLWLTHTYAEDRSRWLDVIVAASELLGANERAVARFAVIGHARYERETSGIGRLANEAVDVARGGDPAVLVRALEYRAGLLSIGSALSQDAGLAEQCRRDIDEALAIVATAGMPARLSALVSLSRGNNELTLGNTLAAADAFEAALALAEPSSRSRVRDRAAMLLATTLHILRDHERAAELLDAVVPRGRLNGPSAGPPEELVAVAVWAHDDPAAAKSILVRSADAASRSTMPGANEEWVTAAAAVLAQCGDSERASQLLSWVRSLTLDRGVPNRSPASYALYTHYVDHVRHALGPEAARRNREAGSALSTGGAVALALEGLSET